MRGISKNLDLLGRCFSGALCAVLMVQAAIATPSSDRTLPSPGAQAKLLQGGVTKTDLGVDLEHKFGITAVKTGGNAKAEVTNVRLGGGGYYAGVKAGDRIVDAKSNKDDVDLVIDRAGKRYAVKLTPNPIRLGDGAAIQKQPPAKDPKLMAELNKPEVQRQMIAKRDVVVIIDRTGSMEITDCPEGQSRWDWCRKQTVGLMKDLLGLVNDITVVTFNEDFQVYPHATLNKVDQIYSTVKPYGATNTASPLHDRLEDYLRRKRSAGKTPMKPLLIAVITDGLPNWPGGQDKAEQEVRNVIIDATKKMTNPDEITVTFLGVGNAMDGDYFLRELDEDIVNHGAAYDIVDTKPFAELQAIGLKRALVDALVESKTTKVSNLPGRHVQSGLAGLMKRKMKLEGGTARVNASGIQNINPTANKPVNSFADPQKAAAKIELQSIDRNIDVLKRAEQQERDIDTRLQQDVSRLQSQANDQLSPYRGFGRMGRGGRGEMLQIQQETQSRIARLVSEAEQRKKSIQADADARVQSENNLDDAIKTQLRGKGSMMFVPNGSNLYVRNYANFGKDTDDEQDHTVQPVRAKAGTYKGVSAK